MSTTDMLSSNSLAVKLYAKKAWRQAMQRTALGHSFNRGSVYFPEEFLGREATGDQITFGYVGKLTKNPVGEGGVARSNEEALELKSHSMSMNVTRILAGSPSKDTIEQQRTHIKFSEQTRNLLTNRAVEFLDTGFFYQLAGANPTSFTLNGTTYSTAAQKLHVQGHNTPVAPSTNRIIRAGAVANDQSLTSSNTFTLDLIDNALETIDNSDQPIEMFDDQTFDLFVSPEQLVDIQHDSSGKIQWFNIELAKISGGADNKIENAFQNKMVCAGKYRNVYIYSAPRVAYGVSAADSSVITTVRRAVLLGKNALSFASPFGGRVTDDDVPVRFFQEKYDLGYYTSDEARLIYGLNKMKPTDKEDIGSFVISTYAAAHS